MRSTWTIIATPRAFLKGVGAALALFLVSVVVAPAALAAPSLEVSASEGLSDGQKITISGSGFAANMSQIAAGQCVEGYSGPSDCNLQGGATFRNADGSGSIGTFTIVVKEKFGAFDCTQVQCVIAAAPLPTSQDAATVSANQFVVPISFGAVEEPEPEPTTEPTEAADPAPSDRTEDTTGATGDLPKTGAVGNAPMMAWAAVGLMSVAGVLWFSVRRVGER